MYKINVSSHGISLQEAIGIISGFCTPDSLAPEKMKWIQMLDGNRNILELEPDGRILAGDCPLPVLTATEIQGNHAVIVGNGGIGMLLMASNCSVHDVIMDHFSTAIMVNAHGSTVENVEIANCRFRNFTGCCILTGSDIGDSHIRNVSVLGCTLEGAPEQKVEGTSDWFGAPVGVMIMAASAPDTQDIRNCTTEQVLVKDCIFRGWHRNSINTIPAAISGVGMNEAVHYANDCVLRDLKIQNCSFAGAYDATINFMGSYMHNVDCVTEGIEVADCYLEYNIWGMWFGATEPCQGIVDGAVIRDIHVHHNELKLKDGGSGEDSAAIAIQAGRLDYADGAKANNGLIENFRFTDNVIHHTQHGIFLNAADSMVDGMNTELIGNVNRNGEISRNRLYNVDDCFTFYGAQLEGRRVDIRLGIPPHTTQWLPLLENHDVTTCIARNNVIENVICRDNFCTGYKFRYKIAGVKAGGHALAEDNMVAESVILENNIFEKGEDHILVEKQIVYDWVRGENNTVPSRYRT